MTGAVLNLIQPEEPEFGGGDGGGEEGQILCPDCECDEFEIWYSGKEFAAVCLACGTVCGLEDEEG